MAAVSPTKSTSNDQAILDLLRSDGGHSIDQLVQKMGVTATAIRTRLSRMMAAGLIERCDVKHGRGRPSHEYKLTKKGLLESGNNLPDFATAIWEEIQSIPDDSVRKAILSGVAKRLADQYSDQIKGNSTEERLASLAEFFKSKNVPFVAESSSGTPVLKIVGCPYPELTSENHEICEMEKELLSKLADTRLTISKNACDCDGHCCTFEAEDSKPKQN